MSLAQEIWINRTTKKLSLSGANFIPHTLPEFVAGETLPFLIGIIEASAAMGAIQSVNATGLSMDIALLNSTQATVLTQSTLTLNGNQFEGDLNLTVAAVTGAVSSGTPAVVCVFEIQIGDAGNYVKAQFNVVLKFSGVTNPVVPSPVPATYLLNTDAAALYVAKAGCDGIVWIDQVTGTRYLESVNSGQKILTPLT